MAVELFFPDQIATKECFAGREDRTRDLHIPGGRVSDRATAPGLCKTCCKTSDKVLQCEECVKRFHVSSSKLGDDEVLRIIESGDGAWYCINCKADCGLCRGAVLNGHTAQQCDSCDIWIHNECSVLSSV